MPESVLIATALAWEAHAVLRGLAGKTSVVRGPATLWSGSSTLGEIAVLLTGIGAERADAGLRFALERMVPSVVLSTGCAGALDASLATGDLVVADAIVDPSGERFATSERWSRRYLAAAERARVRGRSGRMLSSFEVLLGPESKRAERARSGALAVEMEGAALARRAFAAGLEIAAARVILDPADASIPPAVLDASDSLGRPRPLRLAGAMLRAPGLVRDLASLGWMTSTCRRVLVDVHARLSDDTSGVV